VLIRQDPRNVLDEEEGRANLCNQSKEMHKQPIPWIVCSLSPDLTESLAGRSADQTGNLTFASFKFYKDVSTTQINYIAINVKRAWKVSAVHLIGYRVMVNCSANSKTCSGRP
jgi:hypothetical protein